MRENIAGRNSLENHNLLSMLLAFFINVLVKEIN